MLQSVQPRKSKQFVYFFFSLVTAGLVFSYLSRNVSLTEILDIIREANQSAMLAFFICSLLMSIFRTWRYALLLNTSGYHPPPISLFLVVLVRNFFSDLLPARLGTIVYIYIVNTRLFIPLSAATCSFALAFLFDILVLVPMVLVAALLLGTATQLDPAGFLIGGAVLAVGTCGLIALLPTLCEIGKIVLSRILADQTRWKGPLMDQLDHLKTELLTAKKSGVYLPVLGLSLCVRICKYSSLYFLLYALLAPLGYHLSDLAPAKVFIGILAPEIAASLPVSGIAGFGAYEGAWALIFRLLGFPERIADITAISHHLFTQVYGYSLGIAALLLLVLPFFKKRQRADIPLAPLPCLSLARQFAILARAMGLSLIGVVTIAAVLSSAPAPAAGDTKRSSRQPIAVAKEDRVQAKNFLKTLSGSVLFDSNRTGSFGIFVLDHSTRPRVLYDTAEHEMYPTPSPDGRYIAFARSISLARSAPADIWIMNRDGSNPRLIAEDGTFPTWSADGKNIYFERRRKSVMAIRLASMETKKLFPIGKSKFKRYAIVKPRVSPDGTRVAFTSDRKGRWNAWIANLDDPGSTHIARGCEPTWFETRPSVAWIFKEDSKAGSGIFAFSLLKGTTTVIQDGGPPFGHEYFPTLAGGDRFLLHSACPADQHSHEQDNYQLFVKVLGSGENIRLTFDQYTNRWPRLLKSQNS